jgi:hypothetical protein
LARLAFLETPLIGRSNGIADGESQTETNGEAETIRRLKAPAARMNLRWAFLVVSFLATMVACLRANALWFRMIDAVNAKTTGADRIGAFPWGWPENRAYRAWDMYERLYPDGPLREQFKRWMVVFVVCWLFMAAALIELVRAGSLR